MDQMRILARPDGDTIACGDRAVEPPAGPTRGSPSLPGGGDELAVLDHAPPARVRAEQAQIVASGPVGGGFEPEQACSGGQERSGANGRRPSTGHVDIADPAEDALIPDERTCPEAARYDEDVGGPDVIEAMVGVEGDEAVAGAPRAGRRSDEPHVRSWESAQDLVGHHRVECRDGVEEQDDDVRPAS